MRRMFILCAAALLGAAPSAWAWGFPCCNHGIHCTEPPPPRCPDCGCDCDRGHHHCSCKKSERAHQLIEQLAHGDCCCERIKAAQKLGCRLHADYCCDPEVLDALARALLCDPCWEVRKAAAWSITHQQARTEFGVLSLYLASRLDPHYLVRDAATDALDALIVCRRECYKELFRAADALVKGLRGKYKPGSGDCIEIFADVAAACDAAPAAAADTTPKEQLPPPAGPARPK